MRRIRLGSGTDCGTLSRAVLALGITAVLGGCSKGPPPDYAPDPALVARIQEIRMHAWPPQVCPGETVQAEYTAIFEDGTAMPFVTWYDEDNPPPLHVLFLRRTSLEAVSRADGGWHTDQDPLKSVMSGFRLRAEMRHRPDLAVETVVAPEYSCTPYAFGFEGPRGGRGQPGGPGPSVAVRLDALGSPFVDRLLVLGVEVGNAPPFFLLQDLERVPPADWLLVESRGGQGGRGVAGEVGAQGSRGAAGCPGGQGGPGGAGGRGGPGGGGGAGGPITVIVSSDNPYLAGLVDGRSIGGPGGPGGAGGEGGPGGPGGPGRSTPTGQCEAGAPGPQGPAGQAGAEGPPGGPGARPQVVTADPDEVFGHLMPPELRALQAYTRGRR